MSDLSGFGFAHFGYLYWFPPPPTTPPKEKYHLARVVSDEHQVTDKKSHTKKRWGAQGLCQARIKF